MSGDDRFERRQWRQANTWIFIGGEVFGRGFVVKGLTTTYMPRDTAASTSYNMDTLQQRARFFGYKAGYVDLLRGWFAEPVVEKYQDYVDHEEYLWEFLSDQKARHRSLRNARTTWEMSGNARGTRPAASRTGGRASRTTSTGSSSAIFSIRSSRATSTHSVRGPAPHGTPEIWTPQGFRNRDVAYNSWSVSRFMLKLWTFGNRSAWTRRCCTNRQTIKKDERFREIRVVDMASKQSVAGKGIGPMAIASLRSRLKEARC